MTQIRLRTLGKLTLASAILAAAVTPAQVTLVNMVPPTRSPETNQDSEPTRRGRAGVSG